MQSLSDNRAVSALFRVFGGAGTRQVGEASRRAEAGALHRAEWFFLSTVVPLMILVAIGEGLVRGLGSIWGGLLILPTAFLAWTIFPFVVGGASAVWQWRRWLFILTLWAVWRRDAGGLVGGFAWGWLVVFAINFLAMMILAWRVTMRWKGKGGIAWRLMISIVLHAAALFIGLRFGWGWALLAGASFSMLWLWGVLCPTSQWFGPIRCRLDDDRTLITIDDGPDPRDTPVLLDLLDERGVKAVFFVIGEKVRAHPELARQIVKRGHELGNHTLTHPQATFWCASPWRTRREIVGCNQAIEEITGVKPKWFRAPVGHRNFFTHPITAALGMEIMAWTRRGYDAVSTDTTKVLSQLLEDNRPGDIFLIHESTPIAEDVLKGLLDGIEAQRMNPKREMETTKGTKKH